MQQWVKRLGHLLTFGFFCPSKPTEPIDQDIDRDLRLIRERQEEVLARIRILTIEKDVLMKGRQI